MQRVIRNFLGKHNQRTKNPDVDFNSQVPGGGHMEIEGSEEVLVRIPRAVVHLVDGEESVEVGRGEFSLIKLLQGTTGLAILAKVGDDLRWPVTKDEPTVKMDSGHYLFSIRPPLNVAADEDETADSAKFCSGGGCEMLNYGVTFEGAEGLDLLDRSLEQHACFSLPKDGGKPVNEGKYGEKPKKEKAGAEYWADLTPKVGDYNSILAKAIAAGSGQIIKGLFRCSSTYSSQVQKGGGFIRSRTMAKNKTSDARANKSSEISPRTRRNIKRVKKLSRMTEKMSENVLKGVITASSAVTTPIITSKPGKKFFAMMPGEVLLASLDAFNKVLDALELLGREALSANSEATTGVIAHRYGEDAGEVTQDAFEATGHALGAALNVTKMRKAINPLRKGNVSTAIIKSSDRSVSKAQK
uniref:TSA: Wollemia nobilis Ref_Wollemi_Transcript_14587_1738 transcribed RNA sequence n=1 Tax=Wollemia nobilis TaxID=56998 RepID=A0A0C9QPL8_9CONI